MSRLIGRNTRVEVSKTLATAVVINTISKANPGVIGYTGTDPAESDVGIVSLSIDGMLELAGQVFRVGNLGATANTLEMESLNTTSFSTLSGTSSFQIVSAWSTLGYARSVSAGSASIDKKDATVLLDPVKQYVLGQPDTPEITFEGLSAPLSEAQMIVEAAAYAATELAFRITLSDGSKRIFGGYVTLPSENIPLSDLLTAQFSCVQIGRRMAYAS